MNKRFGKRCSTAAVFCYLNNDQHSQTHQKEARNTRGVLLVEMLVAIVVLSFLMIGIMDAMALTRRTSTSLQNQVIATSIAQELLDSARNQTWATLQGAIGTTVLSGNDINRSSGTLSGGSGNVSYIRRALVLDQSNTYDSNTWSGSAGNLFGGGLSNTTVTQTIQDIGDNALNIRVQVQWPAENGPGVKSLILSTIISESGIHN